MRTFRNELFAIKNRCFYFNRYVFRCFGNLSQIFPTFAPVKLHLYIAIVLLAVLSSCQPHPTSPRPSPGGVGVDYPALTCTPSQRGTASLMLENIDSLMWRQPDSAFAMLQEFASSAASDSLDEFNGHYCQLLIAELLFKNYYAQSNREEVLEAVGYFDTIDDAFLAARAHYIKGVGYYERDSLVEACTEYLSTLRIMESHFAENELVDKKARFMALTNNRLMELFSAQFMQEPAIYCGKQSVAYDRIAHSKPISLAATLLIIGKQYTKLNEYDSAAYYYDLTLSCIPDRNTMIYRDWVSLTALNNYNNHRDTLAALDSLKSVTAQSASEAERLNRYLTIGGIYNDIGQYDSAKYYWEPVFELEERGFNLRIVADYLREIALKEGDTLKADQYAQVMAKNSSSPGESQAQVSLLSDMFQSYLQEKQEAASLRERRKAVKMAFAVVLPLVVVIVAATLMMRRRGKQQMAAQHAEAQKALEERERLHKETIKKQQNETIQQARKMLPQRVSDIYHSKVNNRMERIMAEFEAAYPFALEQLATAYPDLNETERQIAVLNFLHFRGKEEADLLGFAENTIMKYRSNLNKKAGSDPISALLA